MSCSYTSIVAQAYEYTHLLPILIPFLIWSFSIRWIDRHNWGFEALFNFYSIFLSWGYIFLWVLQGAFDVMRSNPYCPDQVSMAYPSAEAFYMGSTMSFVIIFTYLWNIPMSEMYWVVVIALLGGPSLLLVWYAYNTVYEVLVSTLAGIILSLIYLIYMYFFGMESLDMIIAQRPWCWLSLVNTWGKEESTLAESVYKESRKGVGDMVWALVRK